MLQLKTVSEADTVLEGEDETTTCHWMTQKTWQIVHVHWLKGWFCLKRTWPNVLLSCNCNKEWASSCICRSLSYGEDRQLFHCRQGRAGSYQDHQGGNVHKILWPIPQQEPRQVLDALHLGWGPKGLPGLPSQATFHHKSTMGHHLPHGIHAEGHKNTLHIGKYGLSNPQEVSSLTLVSDGHILVSYMVSILW